ncbi:MAG: glycosyltransferase family 2 protein [Breznakibacter sp.]
MNNPSLAVVILNWNGKPLLEQFLPEVLANSLYPNVRVIVADNASTDGSREFLNEKFPAVHTIVLDRNYGFAGGYNKALAALDDDYFILLNSDAVPEKEWLAGMFEFIAGHGHIDAAMPKIKSYKQPSCFEYAGAAGGFIDQYGFPFCRGRILDTIEEDLGQYDRPTEIFWASGAALLINSNLYKELGGLDEDFFAHMEEIDLCWRIKNKGGKIWYIPQSIVYHVGGASLHQSHPRKTYLNFRNNLYMLYKNLPSAHLFTTLFSRMILDGAAALQFLSAFKFGFFFAVLKAHLSFYAHLPRLISKRRKLGPNRLWNFHPQIFAGSIAWCYYAKRFKKFSQLPFTGLAE